jgi:hypothetical protein
MVSCKICVNCCRVLAQLEAAGPIHPDDQLKMLKDIVEYEQFVPIREADIQRIEYYLTEVSK